MKVIPQTGHSHYISYHSFLFLFYYERTWWRLFHKHVIRTTLAIFVSIFILLWAYLMKVIPQTRHSHYISYLSFYFYFTYERTWWRLFHKQVIRFTLAISSFLFLFYYERTWWRLFHKHVIRTTLVYLRFYFYFTISVPDEGYSTNTSFALAYLMKAIPQTRLALHYMSSFLFLFYYERTWWRLFHKHVIRFTFYIFISIFILLWAYLMTGFPQTRHSHYISYLRSYFYFTMSVPDEGYSTNTSFTLHYLSSFLFLFYYERTWWRLFHKHVIRTTLYIFVSRLWA